MVRGAVVPLPEPGAAPNNEDIMSPNGLAFAVRGGVISKYSVPNSSNTYEIPCQISRAD